MISVKKDFNTPPTELNTDKRTARIKDALLLKNSHKFDSSVYRDGTINELESEDLYHNKCAYCQTDTTAGAPMQVEHYRPKSGVAKDKTHEGYYWLAYEWSNLLLSCSKCNNRKRTQFPIEGTRIMVAKIGTDGLPETDYLLADSSVYKSEKALLLNPELDEVEKHFVFLPNGEMKALSKQGQKTIEVCDLNRNDLVIKRLSLVNKYFDRVQLIMKDFLSDKIDKKTFKYSLNSFLTEIAALQNRVNDYSRLGYFMFAKFDHFFSNRLETKQRKAIQKAFTLFLSGELSN